MTSSRPARRFDWNNLGLRAASAAVLIPAVLGSIFLGPVFLVIIAISVALLAYEWTAMSMPRVRGRGAALLTSFILAALFAAYRHNFLLAWSLVALGEGAGTAAHAGSSQRRQCAETNR